MCNIFGRALLSQDHLSSLSITKVQAYADMTNFYHLHFFQLITEQKIVRKFNMWFHWLKKVNGKKFIVPAHTRTTMLQKERYAYFEYYVL